MAISKTGGLANTICTPNGIVNKDTGKVIVVNDNSFYVHSKEFMDNWNGTSSDLPKTGDTTTSSASQVKEKIAAALKPKKAAAAPKKKKAWYKKK